MKRRSALKRVSLGLGYTMSGIGFTAFISGCKSEGTITEAAKWAPSFMSGDEASLVESILDAMLPTTETSPGAKSVGAIQIVDNVVNKLFKTKDQDIFKSGLTQLTTRFSSEFGSDIKTLLDKFMTERPEAEQKEIEALMAKSTEEMSETELNDYHLNKVMQTLRSQGISAYFGSETIATEHLNYDPIPGQYNGCMPISETGNVSWSL